jgi:hypothetical protein
VIRTILQCTLVRISDRPGIIGYTGGAQNSAGGGPTVRVIRSRCPRRDGSGGPAVGTAAGELPEAFTAAGDAALLVKQEAGKAGLVEA